MIRCFCSVALLCSTAIGFSAFPALAARLPLTEFSLPLVSTQIPKSLAPGPDGNVWFTRDGGIGRITPAGVVTDFPLAGNVTGGEIVAGPDGNLWFTEPGTQKVGRITPSGVIAELDISMSTSLLTAGADGNLWLTSPPTSSSSCPAVVRLTPAGQARRFPICQFASGSFVFLGITTGGDGNVWFTMSSLPLEGKIGRITPTGEVALFALPPDLTVPAWITRGPDGALWFVFSGRDGRFARGIARITVTGAVSQFFTSIYLSPARIVAGSDGNLWFTHFSSRFDSPLVWSGRTIGRITPTGVITLFHVTDPSQGSGGVKDQPGAPIIRGPDDNIWFAKTASDNNLQLVRNKIAKFGPPPSPRPATIAVFRSSTGEWFVPDGRARVWGAPDDVPVPGDYDGDRMVDLTVYRPATGEWFVRRSSDGSLARLLWGAPGDLPVPADYDGDGTTDVVVYRPSTGEWFVLRSSDGAVVTAKWGTPTDVPVPGDYDGDGLADIAVYRPSTGEWFIRYSSTGEGFTLKWGTPADVPVPGDYDGDGRTDLAVYRPSTGEWFVHRSLRESLMQVVFGSPGDQLVPVDYDGDGLADVAVYRLSTGEWFVRRSSDGSLVQFGWGGQQDLPVPAAY